MIVGILIVGIILIDAALKGTERELASQLQSDFLGTDGFLLWAGSFVAIGALGYVPGLQQTSRYLLVLLLVVIVIRNGGVFQQAQLALQQASIQGPAPSLPPPATPATASGGAAGGATSSGSQNVAGQVGAGVGAAVGTAIFPGVGTVVGGLLGGLF